MSDKHSDQQKQEVVELFRLRYVLRDALERGRVDNSASRALVRLGELAEKRGELRFEYRRWCVQLKQAA